MKYFKQFLRGFVRLLIVGLASSPLLLVMGGCVSAFNKTAHDQKPEWYELSCAIVFAGIFIVAIILDAGEEEQK